MTHHLYRTTALAFAASTLLATLPAGAADMIFTPSTGSGVVVESTPGTPALRVQPTGAVQLPLLPGSTPANGTPVCHDAGGALMACDTSAFTGTPGPKGDPGVDGINGAPGAAGKDAVLTITPEPAGANCSAGGQKVEAGVQGGTTQTRYLCNGVQGPQGVPGTPGAGGGAGIVGLTETRHGCFKADKSITSGTGYTVAQNGGSYTITFNPALGTGNYTLMVDARTSTGRALAVTDSGDLATGMVLTPGWLAADGPETIARICFMLAR